MPSSSSLPAKPASGAMQEPRPGTVLALPGSDPLLALARDTLAKERQLIVFVNTKRGAESQAEKLAGKFIATSKGEELAQAALKVLSNPTKQCRRLAACLAKGVAFHHAGLPSGQRTIIEDAFRDRRVSVICATPTLAAGVDLPAFRVVIRDLKRFGGGWGMSDIPVLEYEQMAGRAGRPGKDPWGEAICIAKDEREAERILETYLQGVPEALYSKLAVEPVLRMHLLSLIASGFVTTRSELEEFFAGTFYAHQYGDTAKLNHILDTLILKIAGWGFLTQAEMKGKKPTTSPAPLPSSASSLFQSARDLLETDASRKNPPSSRRGTTQDHRLDATPLGTRVSELYLDPATAHHLLVGMARAHTKPLTPFGLLHLCASCLELRPYCTVKVAETSTVEEKLALVEDELLALAPSRFSEEHEEFLDTIKTAMVLESWIEEEDEESIMERYGVRPGELHAKKELLDWIIYAASELAGLAGEKPQRAALLALRVRVTHGAKEELLPLLRLKGIGRVRARALFRAGVKDVAGLQRMDATSLGQIVGKAIALSLKEQVGQKLSPEDIQVKSNKRKGQKALGDWRGDGVESDENETENP